jgi:hypothetical protein
VNYEDWWQGLALVEAAHVAANSHPRWKAELARLQPRLGYNKAIVAIARKLLITVWYVLARKVADRFAEAEEVSEKMLRFAYKVGKENRPGRQTATQFARAPRCFGNGAGVDQHSLGFEEANPIATL